MSSITETLDITGNDSETLDESLDVQGDDTLVIKLDGDVNSSDLDITPLVAMFSGDALGPLAAPAVHPNDDAPVRIKSWDVSDSEGYATFALVDGFTRASVEIAENTGDDVTVEVTLRGV